MTAPGWYDDYEDPTRLRWYDGNGWTADVTPKVAASAAAAPPASAPAAPAAGASEPDLAGSPLGSTKSAQLFSLVVVGLFCGLLLGGCLFNGVGAVTPVTEEAATLEDIELDISTRTGSSSGNRRTYYISGTTESGKEWQIASEDAYRAVEAEGWPQQVQVAIGDWTGTAERVTGRSFVVDHQTTGAKIGWTVLLVSLGVISLVATVLIGRRSNAGVVGALAFAVALFVVGNWLGYQAFQWVQSP